MVAGDGIRQAIVSSIRSLSENVTPMTTMVLDCRQRQWQQRQEQLRRYLSKVRFPHPHPQFRTLLVVQRHHSTGHGRHSRPPPDLRLYLRHRPLPTRHLELQRVKTEARVMILHCQPKAPPPPPTTTMTMSARCQTITMTMIKIPVHSPRHLPRRVPPTVARF